MYYHIRTYPTMYKYAKHQHYNANINMKKKRTISITSTNTNTNSNIIFVLGLAQPAISGQNMFFLEYHVLPSHYVLYNNIKLFYLNSHYIYNVESCNYISVISYIYNPRMSLFHFPFKFLCHFISCLIIMLYFIMSEHIIS